eukprot:CAMPEP_0203678412 /NCGR_PEP_ID=MMETSP0090-20130426/31880_1 /ASSEMBLY_ACC=CAM_ASM_001088 /TAXON_ID=426623 /ORGANISM="Chaetoceros affinis, Strain CCMP159" /LENGTH=658 /DNA_ID=CAMNT_0050545645 /DNA_START=38 /DNA_END=2011 /DNA_ORIENTATION=-
MDVSIVAAIGSFIVSERVIKAKATVLFFLLCTVVYDCFIHSNDPVSLRVYRGPACFAVSMIATAFCLRAWRRNGIACDELLFLPGSSHAETAKDKDISGRLPLNLKYAVPKTTNIDVPKTTNIEMTSTTLSSRSPIRDTTTPNSSDDGETTTLEEGQKSNSFAPTYQEQTDEDDDDTETLPLTISQDVEPEGTRRQKSFWEQCRKREGSLGLRFRYPKSQDGLSRSSSKVTDQLKGILKFFSSSQETNEYAPSGPIVASAGLDLCLPVLFNFHLFMLCSKEGDDDEEKNDSLNSIPPQVLPLIFLSILFCRAVIPLKARRRFWSTVHSVISSPFYSVTFRDAFLGEVATSFVRPLQDFCFGIFYYLMSMYGIVTGKISLELIGEKLMYNVLLHNVVLPTCAVLPLLCRFLQTLRQAYDEQRRWPHLGNALKYLSASLVISYGMTHSEEIRSQLWIFSFALCTFQQIWWDVVMDWELITITSKDEPGGICIPFLGRLQLRSKRLFKSNKYYWRIMILNGLFRFTWMLSFIPAYHLNTSTSTAEIIGTFSRDRASVAGFVVSLAELVRRSAWCILKLEIETIKLTDEDYSPGTSYSLPSSRIQYSWFAPKEYVSGDLSALSPSVHTMEMKKAAYRLLVKKLFILELLFYAALYFGLGFVV